MEKAGQSQSRRLRLGWRYTIMLCDNLGDTAIASPVRRYRPA